MSHHPSHSSQDHSSKDHSDPAHSGHHVLAESTGFKIFLILIVLTVVTVLTATKVNLGWFNFPLAMLIASTKALLVCMYFMGLKYDKKENVLIFATSFLFLAIFLVLTAADLFTRGDVYATKEKMDAIAKQQAAAAGASGVAVAKFKKPWNSTPELVAHGKELYAAQCATCHGAGGDGNGPAGAAMNPKPRNFTVADGWKNGRKPSQVFKTLKEGLGSMPAFGSLPAEDRWALAHFVNGLGPAGSVDSEADLAAVGVDPNAEGSGEKIAATIPVSQAVALLVEQARPLAQDQTPRNAEMGDSLGARLYSQNCLSCHGPKGQGGIRVKAIGANPVAYVVTRPLADTEAMRSSDAFVTAVQRGLPGKGLMPGFSYLTAAQLQAVYDALR